MCQAAPLARRLQGHQHSPRARAAQPLLPQPSPWPWGGGGGQSCWCRRYRSRPWALECTMGTREIPTLHPHFCEEGTRSPGSRAPGAALAGTGCWCDPEEPAGSAHSEPACARGPFGIPSRSHLHAQSQSSTHKAAGATSRCCAAPLPEPQPRRAGEAVTMGGPEMGSVPWVPTHHGHVGKPFQQGQDTQCSWSQPLSFSPAACADQRSCWSRQDTASCNRN